jgi:hypothetical protein
MDVGRARAQETVGRSALIGGRLDLWYVSGAHDWFGVEPDPLWKKDTSAVNLREYLSRFDYIVEHDRLSYTTINARWPRQHWFDLRSYPELASFP